MRGNSCLGCIYSVPDITSKKRFPELPKTKKTLVSNKSYFDILRVDDDKEENCDELDVQAISDTENEWKQVARRKVQSGRDSLLSSGRGIPAVVSKKMG